MTQYSQQPDPRNVLAYGAGAPSSGLAIAAMVLGILSLPLMIVLIGPLVAIVAVVLGAVAMSKANRDPMHYGGKGFAITGIVLGAVGSLLMIPLLIAILLPSLGRARELSNRAACAANLRGFTMACVVYANDNSGAYPCVPGPARAGEYLPGPGGYTAPVGSKFTGFDTLAEMQGGTVSGVRGNVLAVLWMPVLTSHVAPKAMVCKSDPAGSGPAPLASPGGPQYAAFAAPGNVSYSIPYPWNDKGTAGGWWQDNTDAELPVVSDMAPMNGTGRPARVTNPATPPGKGNTWNSGNHGGDGQNVGYGDAHVEFHRNPVCGPALSGGGMRSLDNIFTLRSNATGAGGDGLSANGSLGTFAPAPTRPWDVIMVPVRNLDTGGF